MPLPPPSTSTSIPIPILTPPPFMPPLARWASEPTTPENDKSQQDQRRKSVALAPSSSRAPEAAAAAVAADPVSPAAESSSMAHPFTLSPPPTPHSARPRHPGLKNRLRSNSGLSFHTNEEALRQYIDYNPDGSPRNSFFAPVSWRGRDADPAMSPTRLRPAITEDVPPKLPIPDFFDRQVFDLVLKNPTTMERLLRFAESQGVDENVDFLIKVQEYSRVLEGAVAQLSAITSTFTAVAATSPIKFPSPIIKQLDSDTRQAITAAVPTLRNMFGMPQNFVEYQVANTIYPDFVKRQLALCTSAAMSSPSVAAYPGLADAYCLTVPLTNDNPIVAASEGFVELTGYDWSDKALRNCRFLHGSFTSRHAVLRIREAMVRQEEKVELILNYRKDGQPFWNLLYLCPLPDATGRVRFWFGAQVNVSHAMTSDEDIVKLLGSSSSGDGGSGYSGGSSKSRAQSTRPHTPPPGGRDSSMGSVDSVQGRPPPPGSKKSIFKSFRRPNLSNSASAASSLSSSSPRPGGGSGAARQSQDSRVVDGGTMGRRFSIPPHMDAFHTAYGRFMVLQTGRTDDRGNSSSKNNSSSNNNSSGSGRISKHGRNKSVSVLLTVTYCSRGALEALGMGPSADAVTGRDIFAVLAEQACSASVTKSFRAAVGDAVSTGRGTLKLGLAVAVATTTARHGPGERRKGAPTELFVSYWTPLRDGDGVVGWVILVLSPGAAAG